MREILFRGKDIKGNWHIGLLAHIGNAWYISNKAGVSTAFEVIPETVRQYTGLTDKNGKKIFEGDVIKYNIERSKVHNVGKVVYYKGAFCVERYIWNEPLRHRIGEIGSASEMGASFSYRYEYEIVGNIHDNPELLKGGAE